MVQLPAQGDSAYSLLCVRTFRCKTSLCGSRTWLSGIVLTFEATGPGFNYQPREIQPTLYFVLGPPDLIPLCVHQGLNSVIEGQPLQPEGPGFKYRALNMVVFSSY